jgi:hypothetical protein
MEFQTQEGDHDDLQRKTAGAHQKLLALFADVAHQVQNQESTVVEGLGNEDQRNRSLGHDTSSIAISGPRQKPSDQVEVESGQVSHSALREWTENRLADMNLWITGTGAMARSEASLDTRLLSHPGLKSAIATLLMILESYVDSCRTHGNSMILRSCSGTDVRSKPRCRYSWRRQHRDRYRF